MRTLPTLARALRVSALAAIHMRDGTRLFTAIYTPRDTSKRYPIMLMRTPYGVAPRASGVAVKPRIS